MTDNICENCGTILEDGRVCTCLQDAADRFEFVLTTSLMDELPDTINFNYIQLKAVLARELEHYNSLAVTEASVKAAKEDRAKLNKLKDALETKRKEIKKLCLAPYQDFETKVKELVAMVDKPVASIDSQIKHYEQIKKDQKRAEIGACFGESVGELFDILPLAAIWKDEWLNASCSMKKIREEISAKISQVNSDMQVIDTVESDFREAVKLRYLEKLDLNDALRYRSQLQDQARKLQALEARQAEQTAQEAAETVTEAQDVPWCDAVPAQEPPKKYRLRFECAVTVEEAKALAQWLLARNIEYRRI